MNNIKDFSERELLYKVLFDMKKDITDLKKLVYSIMSNGTEVEKSVENLKSELFNDLKTENNLVIQTNKVVEIEDPVYPVYNKPLNENYLKIDNFQQSRENVEDISHETEEESLSLEKNEKDMIIKAGRKNNFKRKYAAQMLGISERTLYRKIKQYDIEDED
jgi:DNA-binding NtrC family response regulator